MWLEAMRDADVAALGALGAAVLGGVGAAVGRGAATRRRKRQLHVPPGDTSWGLRAVDVVERCIQAQPWREAAHGVPYTPDQRVQCVLQRCRRELLAAGLPEPAGLAGIVRAALESRP